MIGPGMILCAVEENFHFHGAPGVLSLRLANAAGSLAGAVQLKVSFEIELIFVYIHILSIELHHYLPPLHHNPTNFPNLIFHPAQVFNLGLTSK